MKKFKKWVAAMAVAASVVLLLPSPAHADARACKAHLSPNGSFSVMVCADLYTTATAVKGRGAWWRTNSNGSTTTIQVSNVILYMDGSINKQTGNLGWKSTSTSEQSASTAYNLIYLPGSHQYYARFSYVIKWPNGATVGGAINSYVT